jgi:hypothetical protein
MAQFYTCFIKNFVVMVPITKLIRNTQILFGQKNVRRLRN